MGCDEHMFVERMRKGVWVPVRPPETNYWSLYTQEQSALETFAENMEEDPFPTFAPEWNFGRDYRAYGHLAGVRVRDIMFKRPAGLPRDVSPVIALMYEDWGMDAHSATFYTLKELVRYFEAENGTPDVLGLGRILQLIQAMECVATEHGLSDDEVRMIVWFDN